MSKYLDKLFKDKNGNVVIGQMPNWPMIVAFIFWATSKILDDPLDRAAYLLFLGFLLWWALLEITKGVNYFRRMLGLTVVVYIVYSSVKIIV